MTTVLSGYYDGLGDTINHFNSLKINFYLGGDVTDLCTEILVDADILESDGYFNPYHLVYVTCSFGGNYDSRFFLREIQNHKDSANFINKLCVCNMDIIKP